MAALSRLRHRDNCTTISCIVDGVNAHDVNMSLALVDALKVCS